MAGQAESPFDAHWESFEAFRDEVRQHRILLGVDRGFARQWMLRGGARCPRVAQVAAYLLVALAVISVASTIYVVLYAAYLVAVFLLLSAYVSWRLFVHLAIANVRSVALRDEALFRRWFDERRLSVLIKATGEYVWNDRAAPS
jgi:hypothetical protein